MAGDDRKGGRRQGWRRAPKPGRRPVDAEQLSFWADLFPPVAAKGCRPAAGYRNDSSLNNAGSNGNYWSSSLNTSDARNGQNLNFNSSSHNTNNNNRYNGQSVRPVTALTRTRLLADLYLAYLDARRHKRRQKYQLDFEMNLQANLCSLADELIERSYRPGRSAVFIVREPKQREVFAAAFRDRVVHHLYYRYTHRLYERTFIYDTYSCIPGRGTHHGVRRLEHHIRQESRNYQRRCYVLKMDIEAYFISIDRRRLLQLCLATLHDQWKRHDHRPSEESEAEHSFVEWLTEVIVLHDPITDYTFAAPMSEWQGLPRRKSLFYAREGCGLPIGNLTSQLFSNVYLNQLDHFMKRHLRCRHYGRYVDDTYVVSTDREWLLTLPPQVDAFLSRDLGLHLHPNKVKVYDVSTGISFLGQHLMPHRRYTSHRSLARISRGLNTIAAETTYDSQRLHAQLNSYAGILSHTRSYRAWQQLLHSHPWVYRFGYFDRHYCRFNLFPPPFQHAAPQWSDLYWLQEW